MRSKVIWLKNRIWKAYVKGNIFELLLVTVSNLGEGVSHLTLQTQIFISKIMGCCKI